MVTADCELLEWDSTFFGRRIGRLLSSRLTEELVTSTSHWCRANQVECLYFLADAADADTTRLAERNQFRLVDVRLTLDQKLQDRHTLKRCDQRIRLSKSEDVHLLCAIARSSHRDSRFYFDPHFPEDRCDALYSTWIEKSCGDPAVTVLVAEDAGRPTGYVSCHPRGEQTGVIGLFGIADNARGRGLGTALLAAALSWFVEQGVAEVSVVTQARNVAAQRLYQHVGFKTRLVQLWYHLWLDPLITEAA